jgi:Tfp pilus assembly protein PilX
MLEKLRRKGRGQVLAGVVMLLVVMLILVPAMVQWVQMDSKASVGNRQNTSAYNLAQAAVERGFWAVKNSTATVNQAQAGQILTGYNFDVTYTDVSGGTYRIKISSGPAAKEITVVGEGRDSTTHQVRALSAVYLNNTLFSPLMSQGTVQMSCNMVPYWGPVESQGDIVLNDNFIGNLYWPQKLAQGVVWCNSTNGGTCTNTAAVNARDTNGLALPNTDNSEWWSDYQYVPEVPVLDFATFRSSAAASNTLNVYGCKATGAAWDHRAACTSAGNHALHFGNSWNHPLSPQFPTPATSTNSYTWYWDNDVMIVGTGCSTGNAYPCQLGTGLWGNIIVRGNLTIDSPGDYQPVENVPVNAWMQQVRINKGTVDTGATNEYPADNGFHKTTPTFTTGWSWTGGSPGVGSPVPIGSLFPYPNGGGSSASTPGIKGFVYVGGNLIFNNTLDVNGVIWVKGSLLASGGGCNPNGMVAVMYDDTLVVPTLNVILTRQSWQEVPPSTAVWH